MQNATMEAAFEPLPSSIVEALSSIVADPTFNIRVIAGGIVGILIYTVVGMIMHHIFYRKVPRNIFALVWHSDLALGLTSLAFGAPVIAGFTLAHEKWGIMKTYMDISEFGWGWWAASIPVYLLMFDFGFYFLHLVLHMEPIYSWSHANHHAFRPPTAWSGIAIDPLETIFSGLAPYLWPLFFVPFHLPTVYVINICLVAWASMLHSACPWSGGWLMMGPRAHNLHHERGKVNGNYGAIFKIYDRIFGTLHDESILAYWAVEEEAAAAAKKSAAEASGKVSQDSQEDPLPPVEPKAKAPSSAPRSRRRATSRSRSSIPAR